MSFHHTLSVWSYQPFSVCHIQPPQNPSCIVYPPEPSLSLSAQPYWQEPLDCHRYLTIGPSLLNPLVLCVITYLIWLNDLRR
jgi:hypothetical protein